MSSETLDGDHGVDSEQSVAEEVVNALTHGLGLLLALAGLVLLVLLAAEHGARYVVSVTVSGSTLVRLYAASTVHHGVPHPPAKRILRVVDHASIYLLIAGSYTPFTLVALRGGWGWSLFGLVWGLALAGVVFKLFFTGRFDRASTGIYVAMGWIGVVAIGPLVRTLAPPTLAWLVGGGLAYTGGTIFYRWRSVPFHHALWHACVLLGSICHFLAVLELRPAG